MRRFAPPAPALQKAATSSTTALPTPTAPSILATPSTRPSRTSSSRPAPWPALTPPTSPAGDCHGLPIEIKVDEQLGRKKLEMDPIAVRRACREYAQKYLDLQRSQFIRMGIFGRWAEPYSTMDPVYEARIAETSSTSSKTASSTKTSSPSPGASTTRLPSPKPRSSTSTTQPQRLHPLCPHQRPRAISHELGCPIFAPAVGR